MMAGQPCDEGGPGKGAHILQNGLRRSPTRSRCGVSRRAREEHAGPSRRAPCSARPPEEPKNAELWLEAIRLEKEASNEKMGINLMAKALQECPDSGVLWAEEIITAPRATRRAKSLEALKRCDNDPHVICAVAGLFVDERKYPKARKWYNRAVTLDDKIGDVWAVYHARRAWRGRAPEGCSTRCSGADPKYGELWCSISKIRRTETRKEGAQSGCPGLIETMKQTRRSGARQAAGAGGAAGGVACVTTAARPRVSACGSLARRPSEPRLGPSGGTRSTRCLLSVVGRFVGACRRREHAAHAPGRPQVGRSAGLLAVP